MLIAGAAIVFLFFVFLIPVHIIHGATVFYCIVAGVGVAVLLYYAIKPDATEIYTPENYEQLKSKKNTATIVSVVLGIVTLISVIVTSGNRKNAYLKKNAVVGSATITDGEAKTTKRRGTSTTSYSVDLEFMANNKLYKENVSISSSEWAKVGKGMEVMVVYAKDHPEICKILIDAKSVSEYVSPDKFKQINLATLATLQTDKKNILNHLQNLGIGWKKQTSKKGNEYYYNSITESIVFANDAFVYVSQLNKSDDFNRIYNELGKGYNKVYDSLATNKKVGAKYESDSFQVRFQQYNKASEKETGGEYSYSFPSIDKVYTIGIANKKDLLILPGDMEDNLDENPQKAAREVLLKKLNKSNKSDE